MAKEAFCVQQLNLAKLLRTVPGFTQRLGQALGVMCTLLPVMIDDDQTRSRREYTPEDPSFHSKVSVLGFFPMTYIHGSLTELGANATHDL
jgi:hypothetical protein